MKKMRMMTMDEFISAYPFLRAVNALIIIELALDRGIILSTLKKQKEL